MPRRLFGGDCGRRGPGGHHRGGPRGGFFGGPGGRPAFGAETVRDRRRRLAIDFHRGNQGGCGGGGRRPQGGCGGRGPGGRGGRGRGPIRLFPYGGGCFFNQGGRGDDGFCGVEIPSGPGEDREPQQGQEGGQQGQQGGQEIPVVNKPDETVLQVKSVDFCVEKNTKAHRTDRYEISQADQKNRKLVIRRGQPFNIVLKFNKEYDAEKDDLKLVFEIGESPKTSNGTYVEFILSAEDKLNEWGAKIVSQEGTSLSVQVFTPPTLYIGLWDFSVEVVKADDTNTDIYQYEHEDPFYVLFNPWNKEDSCYLEDEELLKEYVLNETGKIYSGSQNQITSKPWVFGQFESCVLDVAIYLLDEAGLNWNVRGNPIPIVRRLSAMLNSQDEGGVLTGNWSGSYNGGRSPLSWTGSVAILEKFWENKSPVKFGQCWVFSGLGTTICRALGIPARSITNFASAHDTDGSVTIDSYFTASGERDESNSDDSVWNFHVWNEAWMARPDLPKGYGGWQAFDATPQETSDGVFCCGPVSVQAIKQGEINMPHDAPFVFAEVNADRMYWVPNKRGKVECVHCEKASVGKSISTKAPNSGDREDVTSQYKPAEGSSEERASVLKANQTGSTRHDLYTHEEKDVKFSVTQDSKNTWVGGDFAAHVTFKNTSSETRTVSGRLTVSVMYYTGVVGEKLKSVAFEDITLEAGKEAEKHIKVTSKEYDGKLLDGCMLDMSVWAIVEETNQQFTCKKDFRLRKPHLTIKCPSEVKKGEEFKLDVSFNNPLDGPLTNCTLAVDGLRNELSFPQGNVSSKGTFMTTVPITPKKTGQQELILNFSSEQLADINGSCPIFIQG